jgi:hypothetical protein
MTMPDAKADVKPAPNLFEIGRRLTIALMDPDDCWRDVCHLRAYNVPGPVATCEMAFARAAIVTNAIRGLQSGSIAAEMLAGVDDVVVEAFVNEDSPETLEHYGNQRLSDVARATVELNENNAFPLTQLADVFGHRLSVPGWPAAEIEPLFKDVAGEAEHLMKISNALRKLDL